MMGVLFVDINIKLEECWILYIWKWFHYGLKMKTDCMYIVRQENRMKASIFPLSADGFRRTAEILRCREWCAWFSSINVLQKRMVSYQFKGSTVVISDISLFEKIFFLYRQPLLSWRYLRQSVLRERFPSCKNFGRWYERGAEEGWNVG